MDFGSFLTTPEIKVKIVTYRDIFQDKAMIENRFGEEYRNHLCRYKARSCRSEAVEREKRRHCNPEKFLRK